MSTFETPEPISVLITLGVGHVRIAASDRSDTVVDVRPSDSSDAADGNAARQIRVDCTNGTLRVTGPTPGVFDFTRKTKSVDVRIELPSGSRVSAEILAGDFLVAGRLGECTLRTGCGHVTVTGTTGSAEVATGSGRVQIGEVVGAAVVKNSNGITTIDAVSGDVRVRSANGDIRINRAGAGVDAKTANGSIRVGEVSRGSVALDTAAGDLDIGVAAGTAARLEVKTAYGRVCNHLDSATGPEPADQRVEVRGRTSYGDITIRRA